MDVPVLANQQEFINISSVDLGYNLEDLLGVMDDRDRWRERESQENPRCQHNLMMMIIIKFTNYRLEIEPDSVTFRYYLK